MWARAGSIIPILNHKRELSLLRALVNPICLNIYADAMTMEATGQLVLDDGFTTSTHKSVYTFSLTTDGDLFFESTKDSQFKPHQQVNEVVIYGVP